MGIMDLREEKKVRIEWALREMDLTFNSMGQGLNICYKVCPINIIMWERRIHLPPYRNKSRVRVEESQHGQNGHYGNWT